MHLDGSHSCYRVSRKQYLVHRKTGGNPINEAADQMRNISWRSCKIADRNSDSITFFEQKCCAISVTSPLASLSGNVFE